MTELAIHDPFQVPDPFELEHEVHRPRWWYAQQMRLAGASWKEIANALGYKDDQAARKTVATARRDRKDDKETLEDIVDLELERLDMLQLIAWKQAQAGELKAIQTILAIMGVRMKLLGTEKRPDGGEHTTQNTAIFIGGDSQEYQDALRRARFEVMRKVDPLGVEAGDGNAEVHVQQDQQCE